MDGIARRSTPQLTLIGQPYRYLGYSNKPSAGDCREESSGATANHEEINKHARSLYAPS